MGVLRRILLSHAAWVSRVVITAFGAATIGLVAGCSALEFPSENPPLGLTATAISSMEVVLEWEDVGTGETGFRIERKENDAGFSVVHTTAPGIEGYTDSGLSPDTLYTYRVVAIYDGGTAASAQVEVRTQS
jgi:hypothetical protein